METEVLAVTWAYRLGHAIIWRLFAAATVEEKIFIRHPITSQNITVIGTIKSYSTDALRLMTDQLLRGGYHKRGTKWCDCIGWFPLVLRVILRSSFINKLHPDIGSRKSTIQNPKWP